MGCLMFIVHFPQKSPVTSGSFAKSDMQLKVSYVSSLPFSTESLNICAKHLYYIRCNLANRLQCVAACCSVLQCGAVWCNVVRCGAVSCSEVQCVAECSTFARGGQCVAVCCRVFQCQRVAVSVCCSVLKCAAVWCSV